MQLTPAAHTHTHTHTIRVLRGQPHQPPTPPLHEFPWAAFVYVRLHSLPMGKKNISQLCGTFLMTTRRWRCLCVCVCVCVCVWEREKDRDMRRDSSPPPPSGEEGGCCLLNDSFSQGDVTIVHCISGIWPALYRTCIYTAERAHIQTHKSDKNADTYTDIIHKSHTHTHNQDSCSF